MEAPKCKLCGERHYGLCAKGGDAPALHRPKQTNEKPPVVSTPRPTAGVSTTSSITIPGAPRAGDLAVILSAKELAKLKFDRVAYQRDYMRKRRAKAKEAGK